MHRLLFKPGQNHICVVRGVTHALRRQTSESSASPAVASPMVCERHGPDAEYQRLGVFNGEEVTKWCRRALPISDGPFRGLLVVSCWTAPTSQRLSQISFMPSARWGEPVFGDEGLMSQARERGHLLLVGLPSMPSPETRSPGQHASVASAGRQCHRLLSVHRSAPGEPL